jgi:hypothetical protein
MTDNCLVWNVRGLNDHARRNVVRDERATLVCLQETKLPNLCTALANKILGTMFDYDCLLSVDALGLAP